MLGSKGDRYVGVHQPDFESPDAVSIREKASELIDFIEELQQPHYNPDVPLTGEQVVENSDFARWKALAITNIESGCDYATKAINSVQS